MKPSGEKEPCLHTVTDGVRPRRQGWLMNTNEPNKVALTASQHSFLESPSASQSSETDPLVLPSQFHKSFPPFSFSLGKEVETQNALEAYCRGYHLFIQLGGGQKTTDQEPKSLSSPQESLQAMPFPISGT